MDPVECEGNKFKTLETSFSHIKFPRAQSCQVEVEVEATGLQCSVPLPCKNWHPATGFSCHRDTSQEFAYECPKGNQWELPGALAHDV